jgi:hypothetical protein
MKRKLIFVALAALAVIVCWRILSCNSSKPVISFYYWKTVFELTEKEHQLLADLEVKRLYIRYFDVISSEDGLHPSAIVQFKEKPTCEVVPVVYITTDAMVVKGGYASNFALADSVLLLINNISKAEGIEYKEVQFDCDWTESTEEDYFAFIDLIKELSPDINITSTIRLHQVKYHEQTGIPNVHSGTLMYYNMGRIATDSLNSIYDRTIARQYITALDDYNLPLNIAIPVFSWGVQSRGNAVVDLLNKIDFNELKSDTLFKQNSEREFEAKHNGIFDDVYFAQGDRLKLEYASPEDIRTAIQDISEYLQETPKEIILYDLDGLNFENQIYEKEFFHSLCASF